MNSSSIYFAGLNSGIEWDTLISQLVAIEHKKVDILIEQRNDLVFARSTSLFVNQRIAKLDSALTKLKLESTFLSKKVTSSNETKLTATASTDAVKGTYQISIDQLARAGTAQSGLGSEISASGAYLGANNNAGLTGLTAGLGFEPVRAIPETLFNDLTQASNITDGDTIVVTGTDGNGVAVNKTFTFSGDSNDTLERFAQFLVSAFNGTAQVSIGYAGEIVVKQASGSGTLSFDSSTDITFNDSDFSGSALNLAGGVSYTDGSSQGYGTTGQLTVKGTGLHELTFTQGLPGYILGTGVLTPEDTLENLGVSDFSLTIDPDGSGSQVGVAISGLTGKTTVKGLVDLINYYVPDVTAYLNTTGKLVVQANEGGRNITVSGNLNGVTDILFGNNLSLDTSTPDGITSFAADTSTTNYTVVDRFSTEQGVTQIRKAAYGAEGSGVSNLIGGYTVNGGGAQVFGDGVAQIKTSFSSELNTSPALQTRLMGGRSVGAATSVSSPPLNITNPINNASFATTVTAGTFTINGVRFTISDVSSMTVADLMAQVNSSDAGVVMEYDGANDRFTLRSTSYGPTNITVGGGGDTSNFLAAARLRNDMGAVQLTGRNKEAVTYESILASAGFDTTPTTGTFTINGVSIYIDSSTDSLKTVIEKINRSGAGVTASYSAATDTFTLVQKLDEYTTSNYITIGSATDSSNFLEAVRLAVSPTIETEIGSKRQDAKFTVNGVSFSRPTNTPADIIGGVKLNLLGTTEGTITLTIESDSTTTENALVDFVSEWNATMEFLNPTQLTDDERDRTAELTDDEMNNMSLADIDAYNEERESLRMREFIASDATIKRTVDRLRYLMMGLVQNTGMYNSLSMVGITSSGEGDAASAIESRGRLLTNTTDKDEIRTYIQGNTDLQTAITDHSDDLFKLFSNALTSDAQVTGTKNLNGGVQLTNDLRFAIGNGTNTAQIHIAAGYHTMSSVGTQINRQMSAGGVTDINASFGDLYNLILSNSRSDGLRSQIILQDYSEGTDTIWNKLGLMTGGYYGDDPMVSGGLSVRTKLFIGNSTSVGGILFERTRSGGFFDQQINSLNDAIDRGEESVELYEERLRREYAAMEDSLSKYSAQAQWLEQYLASQNNSDSSNS